MQVQQVVGLWFPELLGPAACRLWVAEQSSRGAGEPPAFLGALLGSMCARRKLQPHHSAFGREGSICFAGRPVTASDPCFFVARGL